MEIDMKALIIVNPSASSGKSASTFAQMREDISTRLKTSFEITDIEWVETQYTAHATQIADAATRQGYNYILAAGGDGTISEVVNGMMRPQLDKQERPVFGVLPWGTLNDFYRTLHEQEHKSSND